MTTIGTTLAVGGSVALVLAIAGLIYLAVRILNHVRGCVGGTSHGCTCSCHANVYTHSGYGQWLNVHRVHHDYHYGCPLCAVDDLRDDCADEHKRLDGRLNRHRRALTRLRGDHDLLSGAHYAVATQVAEHVRTPHDTEAIAAMIAEERERSERAMTEHREATDRTIGELRDQITRMSEHHHDLSLRDIILSTSKRLRALVLAVIVFVVVLLVDFYMPGIQGLFTKTLNLVYNHHSYPIYGLVWDWPRIGVAFALALVTYTIVNILSAVDNTARTVEDEHTTGPRFH